MLGASGIVSRKAAKYAKPTQRAFSLAKLNRPRDAGWKLMLASRLLGCEAAGFRTDSDSAP